MDIVLALDFLAGARGIRWYNSAVLLISWDVKQLLVIVLFLQVASFMASRILLKQFKYKKLPNVLPSRGSVRL